MNLDTHFVTNRAPGNPETYSIIFSFEGVQLGPMYSFDNRSEALTFKKAFEIGFKTARILR